MTNVLLRGELWSDGQRAARAARRRGADAPRAPGVLLVSPHHLGVVASGAVGRPRLHLRHQPSVRLLVSDSGDASEQSGWALPLVPIRAGRRLRCSPAEDICNISGVGRLIQRRAQLTVTIARWRRGNDERHPILRTLRAAVRAHAPARLPGHVVRADAVRAGAGGNDHDRGVGGSLDAVEFDKTPGEHAVQVRPARLPGHVDWQPCYSPCGRRRCLLVHLERRLHTSATRACWFVS